MSWPGSLRRWLWLGAKVIVFGFGAWLTFVLVAMFAYRFIDPPVSALMLLNRAEGVRIRKVWVPLERISPNVIKAVVTSEDGRFCQHHGIDLGELKAAIERASDGIPRGASTISMQTVKNLFLWPGKSYLRKALEIPLTLVMEVVLDKRRILEIYLNIAQWGPGVFGIETAARRAFRKPAAELTEREAAMLAVVLPAPSLRDAGKPSLVVQRLAARVQARIKASPRNPSCIPMPPGW